MGTRSNGRKFLRGLRQRRREGMVTDEMRAAGSEAVRLWVTYGGDFERFMPRDAARPRERTEYERRMPRLLAYIRPILARRRANRVARKARRA